MCLALPGEILEIFGEQSETSPVGVASDPAGVAGGAGGSGRREADAAAGGLATGRVSFGGVIKLVCLVYVPEARVGDHVLVHAGFAIATVGELHAREMLQHLSQIEPERSDT